MLRNVDNFNEWSREKWLIAGKGLLRTIRTRGPKPNRFFTIRTFQHVTVHGFISRWGTETTFQLLFLKLIYNLISLLALPPNHKYVPYILSRLENRRFGHWVTKKISHITQRPKSLFSGLTAVSISYNDHACNLVAP